MNTFIDEALILSSIFNERYVSRCARHLVCLRQLHCLFLLNDMLVGHFGAHLAWTQSIIRVLSRTRLSIMARRGKQATVCFVLRKFWADFCWGKHHLVIPEHGTLSFLTQISHLKSMINTTIISMWLAKRCHVRGTQFLFLYKVIRHGLILTKIDMRPWIARNINLSKVTALSLTYISLLITFLRGLEALHNAETSHVGSGRYFQVWNIRTAPFRPCILHRQTGSHGLSVSKLKEPLFFSNHRLRVLLSDQGMLWRIFSDRWRGVTNKLASCLRWIFSFVMFPCHCERRMVLPLWMKWTNPRKWRHRVFSRPCYI